MIKVPRMFTGQRKKIIRFPYSHSFTDDEFLVLLQAAPNSNTPISFLSDIYITVFTTSNRAVHFGEVKNSLLHSKVF